MSNTKVEKIHIVGNIAYAITSNGKFDAPSIVVAAGAWLERLVDNLVTLPSISIHPGQPAFFQFKNKGNCSTPLLWPSFIHHSSSNRFENNLEFAAYGLFSPGDGIKIGTRQNTLPIDPDSKREIDLEQLRHVQTYVTEWFPGLDSNSAIAAPWFDITIYIY